MAKLFSADCHFHHASTITDFVFRPFKDVNHMDESLMRNWNSRVKAVDEVFHLGDFCFKGNAKIWEDQLSGKILHIRGNHDCFIEETLLLTENGYKEFGEFKVGDIVPSYNLETNTIDYQPILDIFTDSINSTYLIDSKTLAGGFSYNHKLLVERHHSDELYKETCESLWGRKAFFKLPVTRKSNLEEYNKISDSQLKLLAWLFTDSHICKRGYVTFYQSKEEGIFSLEKILKDLDISYTKIERKKRENIWIKGVLVKSSLIPYEFKLNAKESEKVRLWFNLKSKDIYPKWMYTISDRQASVLIDEMVITDGSEINSGTRVIWGKRNRLENILGICVTHNISANIVVDKRKDTYLSIHKNPCVRYVYPSRRSVVRGEEEKIWGVTVKNGTLFTAYRGKPLLSSNSNNGVKAIITCAIVEFANKVVLLQHRPPTMIAEIPEFCDMVLCGHVHDLWKYKRLEDSEIPIINVGVDQWNYMPITIDEIMSYYSRIQKKDGFDY